MLDSFWISLTVSLVLGILSGLGVGGGSLLILWLTLAVKMDQTTARAVNLLFFLPAAFVSCCFRRARGQLPVRKYLPAMIAGVLSAWMFTHAAAGWNTALLRKTFGILLLFTGIRELLYTPRKS